MPFLDRLELAAVAGMSDRAAYHIVADLERRGLAASVAHATDLLRTTRRYVPTAAGLRLVARADGVSLDDLLRNHPVSAQWRRLLLARLDGVAVGYRLAASIAALVGPVAVRWYRAQPLDAAVILPGGRTLGVVRQGRTADRTGVAKRLWRLREGPRPGGVLLLMPDEVRLRHARRRLADAPLTAFLALERDAIWGGPDHRAWRPLTINAIVDLPSALAAVDSGDALPAEPVPARATLPEDIERHAPSRDAPDWLLPVRLRPAEKRALDLLADWPWISRDDLRGLLGVSQARVSQLLTRLEGFGLSTQVPTAGRRLVLTDRGLALLARRDRAAVGAARTRWSAAPRDAACPLTWRNVAGARSRQLLRNVAHTAAVHAFIATMARQAHAVGWELALIDPPHRASRYFPYGHTRRAVHPDAFGVLRRDAVTWTFFLEWERRAVRPATMAARLAPYLRYYASSRPTDDHGAPPAVLIVAADDLAASHFLRVAQAEMDRFGVRFPLWITHAPAVAAQGPFGQVWRTPGCWKVVSAIPDG
ncbi:MAG: MarR family winged helix-turn-helix transcriptional regulator [bacterium]|nr:MarR family winged helix-turn-helix transcriptional regulator [bacterium]